MIKVLYVDVVVEKFRFVIIVFSLTHRLCVDIFHNAICIFGSVLIKFIWDVKH
jgi:hypothetical protein